MSTPIHRRRSKGMRPVAEALETRQLLTKVIRGVDIDGDTWVLKLIGPGDFRVTTQNDVPLNQPSLIEDITIAGGRTVETRLEGRVKRGEQGNGKVFFQNIFALNNPPVPDVNGIIRIDTNGRGLAAIDIPRFWMADTSGGTFTPSTGQPQSTIDVVGGVTSLRFGGVDTTAFAPPTTRGATYAINLGLPQYAGTSIIVDEVISRNRPAATTGGQPLLDTVAFNVQGRLNLFQANAVRGDQTEPTGPYRGPNTGGTTVSSGTDPAGTTGQIGFVRIGGEATNLTVDVSGPAGSPDFALISDFYIGGETNKVSVSAPGGMRNVKFGRGMDTVEISTRQIRHLVANRGANGSTVISNGPIGLASFGGDVIESRILSGFYDRSTSANQSIDVGGGGQITATVAGNIINSFFSASAVPLDDDGIVNINDPTGFLQERGIIKGKYEGTIDNSLILPDTPDQAFFAMSRNVARGPVVPPNAPEAPFDSPARLHRGQIALTKRPGLLGKFAVPSIGEPFVSTGRSNVTRLRSQGQGKVLAPHVTPRTTPAVPKGPAGRIAERI